MNDFEVEDEKRILRVSEEAVVAYGNRDGIYWKVNKNLTRLYGAKVALFIADLLCKYDYFTNHNMLGKDGYFYNTQKNITEDTGFSGETQTSIIKHLKDVELLTYEKRGMPGKNYYKLDMEKLVPLMTSKDLLVTGEQGSKLPEGPLTSSRRAQSLNNNKRNKNKDNETLNTLRNVFKEAEPSTTTFSGRLHRRKVQDTPYLTKTVSKSEEVLNPSYKKVTLKENRVIPSLLDSSSDDVKDVVRLWNSFGKPLTCHKPDSKIMERAVKQIQTCLTTHSLEDIKCAIRQYYKLVTSSDTSIHSGIPGHVVGLDEFFNFSTFTRERMTKQKVQLKIKNWFDECLPSKDPVAKYVSEAHSIPDSFPKVTKKFKRFFVKKVLGGIEGRFTPREENCFKRGSMKMMTFLKSNGKNLLLDPNERNPLLFVDYVFAAIESQTNGKLTQVTPGWFSNDGLYTKTLPAYLHNQAMVRDFEG